MPAESAAWAKEFEQAAEHSRNQDYEDIWKHYGEVSRHLQSCSVCCAVKSPLLPLCFGRLLHGLISFAC
jgi:hypothetical protein